LIDVAALQQITLAEFADIVQHAFSPGDNDLRIVLIDGSYMKIWFSLKVVDRCSYHWARGMVDKTIYRHDNAPDAEWKHVSTYPKHFHNGSQENVMESWISDKSPVAVREFLKFARTIVKTND